MPNFASSQPSRNPIKDGVWLISARLVIDRGTGATTLVDTHDNPLVLSDSWLNSHLEDGTADNNFSRWLNGHALRHAPKKGRRK